MSTSMENKVNKDSNKHAQKIVFIRIKFLSTHPIVYFNNTTSKFIEN